LKIITYELVDNDSAIRCAVCRTVSYDPGAIVEKTCPQCGIKHNELAVRIEKATREHTKREQHERAMLKYSR
jgi:phage FluMu protein Com